MVLHQHGPQLQQVRWCCAEHTFDMLYEMILAKSCMLPGSKADWHTKLPLTMQDIVSDDVSMAFLSSPAMDLTAC